MKIVFLQGFSGAGKTSLAANLSQITGAIHLDRDSMVGGDRKNSRALAYKRLNFLIKDLALSQKDLVIDAPFLLEIKDGSFQNTIQTLSGHPEVFRIWLSASPGALQLRREKRNYSRDRVKRLDLEIKSDFDHFKRPIGVPFIDTIHISKEGLVEVALWLTQACQRQIEKIAIASRPAKEIKKELIDFAIDVIKNQHAAFLGKENTQALIDCVRLNPDSLFGSELYIARRNGGVNGFFSVSPYTGGAHIFPGYGRDNLVMTALLSQIAADQEETGAHFLSAEILFKNNSAKNQLSPAGFVFSNQDRSSRSLLGQKVSLFHRHI